MKKNSHYSLITLALLAVGFFSSCSSQKYGAHFQPSKHAPSKLTNSEKVEESAVAEKDVFLIEEVNIVAERSGAGKVSSDVLPNNETLKKMVLAEGVTTKKELLERNQQKLEEVKERLNSMSRKEKRQLRREIRKFNLAEYTKDLPVYERTESLQDIVITEEDILPLVFAVIVPPLGVYLHERVVNEKFWISLLLTVLGVSSFGFLSAFGMLPAIAYSVLVVLDII